MSGALLRLEGIRKRFGRSQRPALDGVDLEVEAGSILVLLGTSGAGKTTLLRIVAGLEEADAGRVVVAESVLSDPKVRVPPEQRGVGLVFQHLELWSHMTVAENVAFGLPGRPRGRSALRNPAVVALAERVGVADLLPRRPATLSGGERQRVAIARTLAPDPQVVLYDEPLANLDPERRRDLRRLIRRLCKEHGSTLLYVTHDAEEAMELGDEIAVVHDGRVADQGPPERLYLRPATLAVARALGAANVLSGDVAGGVLDTVLGPLETFPAEADGHATAIVRPEQVHVEGRGEADIVEVRPGAGAWSFTARVGDVSLEGRSRRLPEVREGVGLRVRGAVALVREEDDS